METLYWTKKQAREYTVKYHFLNLKEPLKTKSAIKDIFDRLLTIQYDPLDCVGRNPDLVLHARIKDYKKEYLYEALYKERYLIDGWDKQMSIFRTVDFPYFDRVRIAREKASLATFEHHNIREAVDYKDDILNQIRERGPLYSREINLENKRWINGKISSITLDYLFNIGDIIVYDKANAQKRFELYERVFNLKEVEMTETEFTLWYLKRRIKTLGFFWNKGTAWSGLHIQKRSIRTKYLGKLLEEDYIVKVMVEDIKEPFYVIKEFINNPAEIKKQISVLAPLDNLNWDRELVKKIFDFDYKWEVYVPKTKRVYGYYVLPLLYGDEFIGRIEFNNHRLGKPLEVIGLWYEPMVKVTKIMEKALNQALIKFAKYLEASEVIYNIKY